MSRQALAVPETINADNAVAVFASLSQALADGERGAGQVPDAPPAPDGEAMVLDLAPLKRFDSSALSLLLHLARNWAAIVPSDRGEEAQAAGQPQTSALTLLNPPAKLQELAELYGVAGMLFGAQDQPSK